MKDNKKTVCNQYKNLSVNIPVIYEDNHLLVVEKPVNIPTQEDASKDPDLHSILKDNIKVRYQKPGNVYLGIVHRLDRPVGGVMIFARTSKAASRLSEQIRSHGFKKVYLAVIHGIPKIREKRLEHFLEKDKRKNIVRVVPPSSPDGKKAILEYNVAAGRNNLSLVKIQLLTGRSHQIRVQFQAIGHPLFGDQKYGAKLNIPGQQIALWSHEITIMHPVKKEAMTFRSKPPCLEPWDLFYDLVENKLQL